MVTCRKCREKFVRKDEEENITWVRRSKGWYYHKTCWEKYKDTLSSKENMKRDEEEWLDLIFYLISNDLKSGYNYHQILGQAQKFKKDIGLSYKDIYYCLHWFFFTKKAKYDEKYGIGIIPYIYKEAIDYWLNARERQQNILEEIEKLKRAEMAEGREIKVKEERKKRGRDKSSIPL